MKVVILGAGRMGCAVGACMKLAGDEVILCDAYKEHIDKINEKGLDWQINDEAPINIRFDRAVCRTDGIEAQDVAIVLTSGNDTDKVMEMAMGNVIGPDTYVVTFQNGLGHTDKLQKYVDVDRILYGMLKLGGWMNEPGFVKTLVHPVCCVVIGSVRQEEKADTMAALIAEHIQTGGIISAFHKDIEYVVWEKVLNNCAFNPLCSLTRSRMKNVIAGEHGRPVMIEVVREVVAVANAKGIALEFEKAMDFIDNQSLVNLGNHFPSMTYDVRDKRRTEIDFLNGTISRYGKELGVPTPVNDMITLLMKTLEDGYDEGF